MAVKLLLPGWGGLVDIALADTEDSDVFDMSRCAQFAAQLLSEVGTNSMQLEQSFSPTGPWVSLGSALASAGNTGKYDLTDGPHGFVRVVQTGSGSGILRLVGWPIQIGG